MGRGVYTDSGVIVTGSGVNAILAGMALAKDDLVQFGSDGKVYPLSSGDLGKITNSGAAVFAETSYAAAIVDLEGWRPAVLKHSNGDIYTVGASGCTIKRFSALGDLKKTTVIDSASSNNYQWRLAELSNGSIVVTWCAGSPIYVSYAVVDAALTIVKAVTQGSYQQTGSRQYGLCALSGGGFAVSWSDYNSAAVRFRVFDNTGTATIGDTQWGTAAVNDPAASAICQLSDGNLALVRSGSTAGVNTKYAIYTTGGVQVKAETQLTATSTPAQPFILQAGNGYFCLRIGGAGAGSFYVFNNAGVQQGAVLGPLTEGGLKNPSQILWDGTDFYIVYGTNGTSGTLIRVVKLPVTGGANAVSYDTYTTTTAATSSGIDAYWEGSNIAVIALPYNVNQKPSFGVVSKAGATVSVPVEFGTAPGTTQGNCVRGFSPVSPFAFGAAWEQTAATSAKVMVVKNFNTAILGVAQAAANAGEIAPIATGAGIYKVNPLTLSATPMAFDHTTGSTVPGNKGTMLTNSIILRGI